MKGGTFIKVICPRCKKAQVIFGKAATQVKCIACNNLLTKNRGGKAKIMARVEKIVWR
ncbi:MAG: 30S ribosomal protein S27e [Nanoarchaeota archaeon]